MKNIMTEKNCSIVDNKTYLYMDIDDISDLSFKKIGQGSEADIYKFNRDILFKVYKKELIDEMEEIYNAERIDELSMKKGINKNILPIGPLYLYGDFIGCTIHNCRFSLDFDYFDYVIGLDNKIDKLIEINEKLHDLEQNNMYYIDLKSSNILLQRLKTPEIVGIDGNSVRLMEDRNGYYSYRMYSEFFCLIIEKIFRYKMPFSNQISIDEVFESYNIPKKLKKEFYNENYNYEVIRDFLYYIKEDIVNLKNSLSSKKLTFSF